jgi:hypothetical protein
MADDYSEVQSPESDYSGVQNPASPYGAKAADYPSSMQKKPPQPAPATQPSASTPATQATPQQAADAMVSLLASIYKAKFSKNRQTLGPKVGKSVKVTLVSDADMTAALDQQAVDIGEKLLAAQLKFNPQSVIDRLQKYYKAIKKPFPYSGKTIDENTKLTREEEAALFGFQKAAIMAEVRRDVDKTQGFYSTPKKGPPEGIIFIREAFAKEKDFEFLLAGTLAHELGHAYTDQGWRDFLLVMFANGMLRTGPLEEGMTTHMEEIIVAEWHSRQPANTLIPLTGYRNDPDVADSAKVFIDAVGEDLARLAYFGGWVDFKDPAKPQDSILVGQKGKSRKEWKWPWQ